MDKAAWTFGLSTTWRAGCSLSSGSEFCSETEESVILEFRSWKCLFHCCLCQQNCLTCSVRRKGQDFFLSQSFLTDSGAHPNSYSQSIGVCLSWAKQPQHEAEHLCPIVSKLRMNGCLHSILFHAFIACLGTTVHFTFIIKFNIWCYFQHNTRILTIRMLVDSHYTP